MGTSRPGRTTPRFGHPGSRHVRHDGRITNSPPPATNHHRSSRRLAARCRKTRRRLPGAADGSPKQTVNQLNKLARELFANTGSLHGPASHGGRTRIPGRRPSRLPQEPIPPRCPQRRPRHHHHDRHRTAGPLTIRLDRNQETRPSLLVSRRRTPRLRLRHHWAQSPGRNRPNRPRRHHRRHRPRMGLRHHEPTAGKRTPSTSLTRTSTRPNASPHPPTPRTDCRLSSQLSAARLRSQLPSTPDEDPERSQTNSSISVSGISSPTWRDQK